MKVRTESGKTFFQLMVSLRLNGIGRGDSALSMAGSDIQRIQGVNGVQLGRKELHKKGDDAGEGPGMLQLIRLIDVVRVEELNT